MIIKKEFGESLLFKYWISPILLFPRYFAIMWGVGVTVIGRLLDGEARRGVKFIFSCLKQFAKRGNV
jgi:hypothetical protein